MFIRGEEVTISRTVYVDCDVLESGTYAVVEDAADKDGVVTVRLRGRLERVPEDALRELPPPRRSGEP
jgi:hypothetical protein